MVQAVNTKAIFTLASVVRRPYLLVPHVSAPTISQVNYDAMKECGGVQGVIFDKDNTLSEPYALRIHPEANLGLQNAIRVFGVEAVAILSNSAGTGDDPDFRNAIEIQQAFGIPVIMHEEKKPGGLQNVLDHFEMSDPARLCMVGDRLLTDIVFGNLHGMLTVHTLPLCRGNENGRDNWTAKLLRPMENSVLYRNWFGARRLLSRKLEHKYWSEQECPLILSKEVVPPSI
jgi:phosphatidylglycerophosphatase GEP4